MVAAELSRAGRASLVAEASASAVAYRRLAPPAQRLLSVVAVLPGPDHAPAALAAAMACRDADLARSLDVLAAAGLVRVGPAGRWSLTDAARALRRTDPENRAVQRWYEHYLVTVSSAAESLYPHALRLDWPGPHTGARHSPPLPPAAAAEWFDAELPTLTAAVHAAVRLGMHRFAWLLADGMRGRSWQRPAAADWLALAVAARDTARSVGDGQAAAAAYLCLADAAILDGQFDLAVNSCTAAERRAGRVGWLSGRAAALANRGGVFKRQGRLPEALDDLLAAVELFGAAGRMGHKASAYTNIGLIYQQTGEIERAVAYHRRALLLYQQTGSQVGEARALRLLAEALRAAGRPEAAERGLRRALAAYSLLGNRAAEAHVRSFLGDLRR